MIKFGVNKHGVYLSRDNYSEFGRYVMTTKEIVNKIIITKRSPIGENEYDENSVRRMLTSFFNDPNRSNLKICLAEFTDLNFGYGVVDNVLKKIIMWKDDNDLLNFAMYDENISFNGHIVKIQVTDGDVFIKDYNDAIVYMGACKNKQLKESEAKAKEQRDLELDLALLEENLKKVSEERKEIKKQVDAYKSLLNKHTKLLLDEAKLKTQIYKTKHKLNK